LIFTDSILYLHYPKTGGMTLTGELISKLKGDVYYSLPKSHLSPREKLKKWTGQFRFVEGIRHENLEQAKALLEKIDFHKSLEDFEKIFVVIRNPYDYIVSRFHYLQRDQKHNTGPAAKIAAEGDFRKYVLEAPRFYPPQEYLLNADGKAPSNLHIIKFEDMHIEINELLKQDLKRPISFKNRYNSSEHKDYPSYIT